MSDRATMDELRKFANAVRAAGGGNPIDALMPSVPEDPSACLIAKNLNFNCAVEQEHWNDLAPEEKDLIRDFLPYIEESESEAYELATIINPDGSITL